MVIMRDEEGRTELNFDPGHPIARSIERPFTLTPESDYFA